MRKTFLRWILPSLKVNRSTPLASMRLPSAAVPVKVHSETPKSPLHEVPAVAPLRIGHRSPTPRRRPCAPPRGPTWRVPQASGPAAVSNTQSSLMKDISASMSWRFQASLNSVSRATVVMWVSFQPLRRATQ